MSRKVAAEASTNGPARPPGLSVACIVPTRNGRTALLRCLASLAAQTVPVDAVVVDSESSDGTEEVALAYGARVVRIRAAEFNHGRTRQLMFERHPGYDVYVYMTQDAYLEDEDAVRLLVAPFADEGVGAVCGRQLPHLGASAAAAHARVFNYPASSRVVGMADATRLGMRAAFMSNSFAAYRGAALKDAGGFPEDVILAEDMYVAARMLLKGWKVAYEGRARARHSHDYTLAEEFRRYFDIGVFHSRESWIRRHFGGAGGEGVRYVVSELRYLGLRRAYRWPASVARSAAKLLAYKLGRCEACLPADWKRRLSMHTGYWERAGAHAD